GADAPGGGPNNRHRPTEHQRTWAPAPPSPRGGRKAPLAAGKAPTALRSTNVGWSTHRVGHRGARKPLLAAGKTPTALRSTNVGWSTHRVGHRGARKPLLAAGRTPTALRQTKFDQATVTPTAQDVQDRSPNG